MLDHPPPWDIVLKKQSKQQTIPSEIPQKLPATFSYSAKGP